MENKKDYYQELFEQSFKRLLWIGIALFVGVVICVLLSSSEVG